MSKIEFIDNWQDKKLVCFNCGSRKSVKYKKAVRPFGFLFNPSLTAPAHVFLCNKCALLTKEEEDG